MKEYKDWTLEEARRHCDDRYDSGEYCKGCELDGVCCEKSHAMVPRLWRTDKRLFSEEEIAFAKTFQAACDCFVTFIRYDDDTLVWSSGEGFEHRLPYKMFPSIKPGQKVWLRDIIGED